MAKKPRKDECKRLTEVAVDEISLVDTPAVEDAVFLIAKRAEEAATDEDDEDMGQLSKDVESLKAAVSELSEMLKAQSSTSTEPENESEVEKDDSGVTESETSSTDGPVGAEKSDSTVKESEEEAADAIAKASEVFRKRANDIKRQRDAELLKKIREVGKAFQTTLDRADKTSERLIAVCGEDSDEEK